nr:MAG TPA: hypothetical protein [Caudoviricetes sp.]
MQTNYLPPIRYIGFVPDPIPMIPHVSTPLTR